MELRQLEINDDTIVLSINGDMDAAGCQNIQSTIDDVISKPHPHIDVDMENVAFLDSSGIGALVYLYKRLTEKQHSMRIKNAHGQPLSLLKLLRIENAIPVNESRE
ncbi:anti-sigma factor antagonist [Photobacterium kishitanii]|uniref:Anti-sigma factor antagonist n=1 Tax=Photobacterium kishitanii TaxID=318456 RepID=A0A0B7JDM9_9GAMM|nr:STAS domain-containing protein [Photobacterium kishitanii]PSU86178.1 anti-sigma factor antagonist [Photobacterium kishitanii]PSU96823.1 anti-sigma factor antagonist [Photobacterium kishitanii]PSU96917.1 anti-sigma factor antagonist [Photobacterium kishitanii]PSV25624.1 anti-sigma factor antagonist [Photobacterium kishitanii]PSW69345.1 anti-sigma factor antagonist [Photobacterium kishitanii]